MIYRHAVPVAQLPLASSEKPLIARPIQQAIQIVWYALIVIELILGLRFLLSIIGTDPNGALPSLVYALSAPFMAAFISVFQVVTPSAQLLGRGTLLAMAVYFAFAWLLVRFILLCRPFSPEEIERKFEDLDPS